MARKDIEKTVEEILEYELIKIGYELVDAEYVRERNWILRLYIDKEGGVDLSDCQRVSEKAGEILDAKDLIPGNYLLEVSSPGIDRVIKKDKDFIRFSGQEVDVKLFAPLVEGKKETKNFTAVLDGLADTGEVKLILEGKDPISLAKDKISQMRLHFSF